LIFVQDLMKGLTMKYSNILKGVFVSRPNRFIAIVSIGGRDEICHVKNTGRLGEILASGCTVYVQKCSNPSRKTQYDLIAAEHDGQIINIDSQAPNKVIHEWLKKGGYFKNISLIKPECRYKNSRFDFYVEADGRKTFIEVKGVTLKNGDTALFPDAPTERGVKHLYELCDCIGNGYDACVIFLAKMKGVRCFSPNSSTHPEFAKALKNAENNGVRIICMDCNVTCNSLEPDSFIEIKL